MLPLPAAGNLLDALEVDLRAAVVEQGAQLRVLRVAQIALRLHDEEVRREADVEAALLGVQPLLREITRHLRGLHALAVGLDLQRGVGHLGGDLQLELTGLRDRLLLLHPGAGEVRVGRCWCRSDS